MAKGKVRRRRFTPRQVAAIVWRQTVVSPDGWPIIRCHICRQAITLDQLETAALDHIIELAMGGADVPENCGFVHDDCHKGKSAKTTKVRTKADRQGGRKGQYARRKRRKDRNAKPLIKSRSFDKRYKKKMDGSVVEKREDRPWAMIVKLGE